MNHARRTLAGLLLASLYACGGAPADTGTTPSAQPAAVTEARLAELARNVEAAEAVRSIKRLQWAYGHYSELGLWNDFADLFADTGVGHYVQGDLDREGIRKLFVEQVGQGQLGLADGRIYPHISFSPVVTLDEDGEHAHARFRILAMLGGYGGNATWFHGLYENAYVKERGVWKVNELSNTAQVTGNFTAGLAAGAAPLDGPAFAFHYTPAQVGSMAEIARGTPATLASLQQRAERLADEAALTNLQHQYGYYLDAHDWDALAALFADSGTFESGQQGVYSGKASIRRALDQFGELAPGEIDDHILFQTYVSIAADGQSAAARVDELGLRRKADGTAVWTQGIFENRFVKEGPQWRIQAIHYYPRLITDFNKGWAADAQPVPGIAAAFPPDAPPSESYAIYPTFYLPAFHFNHPVTGNAPQYPEGSPAQNSSPAFAAQAPRAAEAGDVGELAAMQSLAQQALARDAVENLVNAYAYYFDECMSSEAAQLRAEPAGPVQSLCPAGRQEGIMRLHHAVQPVIVIAPDGRSATVQSKFWEVSATPGADSYQMLHFQGTAVLQAGQWKLAQWRLDPRWSIAAPGVQPIGQ